MKHHDKQRRATMTRKTTAPAAAAAYLFEDINHLPIPRLAGGHRPDGRRFFDLAGAVKHFRCSEGTLKELHAGLIRGGEEEDRPPVRLSSNGRPVRVGCLVASQEGRVGLVTYVAGNIVVYKLLPNQPNTSASESYSADFRHEDVSVLLDAAEPATAADTASDVFWDAVGRLVQAGADAARAAILREGPDTSMVFEAAEAPAGDGEVEPVPLLPMDVLGRRRVPDGRKVLSLAQAAERFGRSHERLRKLWRAAWGEIWGEPAARPTPPPAPAARPSQSRRQGKGRAR